jgi:hypothetical protein
VELGRYGIYLEVVDADLEEHEDAGGEPYTIGRLSLEKGRNYSEA